MKNPKISIITVVFNSEKYLENTILSIIHQTYPFTEYIIIDGGSKDNTVNIIKKYEKYITYWVSEPDKGLYDAMNKGLKAATGDFVWFINSGDRIYSEEVLENFLRNIEKSADIYYGETVMIDENGKEIGMRRLKTPEHLTWKSLLMGMVVSHQSIIVKKSNAPLFDLTFRFSADFEWVIKSLRNSQNIVNTNLILSKFLDGGLTKHNIIPGLKERFRIMIKNYGFFKTIFNHLVLGIKFLTFVSKHKRF